MPAFLDGGLTATMIAVKMSSVRDHLAADRRLLLRKLKELIEPAVQNTSGSDCRG